MKSDGRMKQEVDINININVQDFRKNIDGNAVAAPLPRASEEKIKSNLSVSQLAFLFRLLHDKGALSVKNQTDILKFISDNFQTPNAPEISTRSLRAKNYSVDLATKESIKLLINKMLGAVDSY